MNKEIKKFAVLIDADNTCAHAIEPVIEEIAKYGIASVKRIYGDWSMENLQTWRDKLLPNAITPVQQFAYVKQKDATDMKLVIDAMDLLYAGDLDGFCIVSSDSDFTPLVSRIRESGLTVYGFGKQNTVNSFVNACDRFFYIENLMPLKNKSEGTVNQEKTVSEVNELTSQPINIDSQTLNLIYKAVKECTKDNGWASLSEVGSYISTVKPDFDTRTYGYSKLSEFINSLPKFESNIVDKTIYVRKFSFAKFISCIRNLISQQVGTGDWMSIKTVAHILYQQRHANGLDNHNQDDILQKIKAIYGSYLEFDEHKTKVKLPIE